MGITEVYAYVCAYVYDTRITNQQSGSFTWTAVNYITVHENVVADASGHNKEMEDLVGAEIFMLQIKKGYF